MFQGKRGGLGSCGTGAAEEVYDSGSLPVEDVEDAHPQHDHHHHPQHEDETDEVRISRMPGASPTTIVIHIDYEHHLQTPS
jgi:hypothetical protein